MQSAKVLSVLRFSNRLSIHRVSTQFVRRFCSNSSSSSKHLDDEFAFPVFVAKESTEQFIWSGGALSEQFNLTADNFLNRSVIVVGKSAALVKANHAELGNITFAAVRSVRENSWKFCSVVVFGNDLSEDEEYRLSESSEIADTVNNFVKAFLPNVLTENDSVDTKPVTSNNWLAANIPSFQGHFQIRGIFPEMANSSVELSTFKEKMLRTIKESILTSNFKGTLADLCDIEVVSVLPIMIHKHYAWYSVQLCNNNEDESTIEGPLEVKFLVLLKAVTEGDQALSWQVVNIILID